MKEQDIELLNDRDLVWACVGPVIQQVRGKDLPVKSRVYRQLSSEQRALFMFKVLYGHADRGMYMFFQHMDYLVEAFDIWAALKASMKYFGDNEMHDLIGRMEDTYHTYKQNGDMAEFDELDAAYMRIIPGTLKLVGSYLRKT